MPAGGRSMKRLAAGVILSLALAVGAAGLSKYKDWAPKRK